MTFYSATRDIRASTIFQLEHRTRELVNDPDSGRFVSGNSPAVVEAGLSVLNETMAWYLKMVTTTSGRTESSLPDDEREALKNARHQLRVLNALYGPKTA
jgi:hypothetical protein